jgi:hypothetical protein
MKPKMIKLVLAEDVSIDSMTIKQAVEVLQRYDENARIDFLLRWDYDTSFCIELEREQTKEEAEEVLRKEMELLLRIQENERKEYERLKNKFEKCIGAYSN